MTAMTFLAAAIFHLGGVIRTRATTVSGLSSPRAVSSAGSSSAANARLATLTFRAPDREAVVELPRSGDGLANRTTRIASGWFPQPSVRIVSGWSPSTSARRSRTTVPCPADRTVDMPIFFWSESTTTYLRWSQPSSFGARRNNPYEPATVSFGSKIWISAVTAACWIIRSANAGIGSTLMTTSPILPNIDRISRLALPKGQVSSLRRKPRFGKKNPRLIANSCRSPFGDLAFGQPNDGKSHAND